MFAMSLGIFSPFLQESTFLSPIRTAKEREFPSSSLLFPTLGKRELYNKLVSLFSWVEVMRTFSRRKTKCEYPHSKRKEPNKNKEKLFIFKFIIYFICFMFLFQYYNLQLAKRAGTSPSNHFSLTLRLNILHAHK